MNLLPPQPLFLLQPNKKAVCLRCKRDPRCRLSFPRATALGPWFTSQVSLCRFSALVICIPHILTPLQPEKHHAVRSSLLEDSILNLSFLELGDRGRCSVAATLRAEDLSWSGAGMARTLRGVLWLLSTLLGRSWRRRRVGWSVDDFVARSVVGTTCRRSLSACALVPRRYGFNLAVIVGIRIAAVDLSAPSPSLVVGPREGTSPYHVRLFCFLNSRLLCAPSRVNRALFAGNGSLSDVASSCLFAVCTGVAFRARPPFTREYKYRSATYSAQCPPLSTHVTAVRNAALWLRSLPKQLEEEVRMVFLFYGSLAKARGPSFV